MGFWAGALALLHSGVGARQLSLVRAGQSSQAAQVKGAALGRIVADSPTGPLDRQRDQQGSTDFPGWRLPRTYLRGSRMPPAYTAPSYSRAGLSARSGQSDQAQVIMEMGQGYDMDQEIEGLSSSVSRLKQMSKAIQEETHLQKQITDSLGETLERSTAALKQGMRRLNKAYKQSKSNHLLYLVFFALAIFVALYLFAKAYRTIRWLV